MNLPSTVQDNQPTKQNKPEEYTKGVLTCTQAASRGTQSGGLDTNQEPLGGHLEEKRSGEQQQIILRTRPRVHTRPRTARHTAGQVCSQGELHGVSRAHPHV